YPQGCVRFFRKRPEEVKTGAKYEFVRFFRKTYTVNEMRAALKISESGYYRWLRNRAKVSKRQLLLVEIQKILEQHPDNDNYGVKRIHTALEQKGIKTSPRTVYRAMKEGGYLHKRRVSHGITKADTEVQEKENLIKQDFRSEEPFRKFLTDITEVPCRNGKLYVSPIMDCFNGEIVALEMRDNMKKELCIDTVKQLKRKYGKQIGGAIIHSDRGSGDEHGTGGAAGAAELRVGVPQQRKVGRLPQFPHALFREGNRHAGHPPVYDPLRRGASLPCWCAGSGAVGDRHSLHCHFGGRRGQEPHGR
ncbi:MAG: IS3 family transposase, partial [Oscillospiraceae bacterium]|nr:IS3 family transposase [Oscillospiraceae bacterium]